MLCRKIMLPKYRILLHKRCIFQFTELNFCMCRYVLRLPQNISFTTTGVTKIDSEYFCKVTVLLWLDKDEFLKDTEQKKLEVEHELQISNNVKIERTSNNTNVAENKKTEEVAKQNRNGAHTVDKIFLRNILQDVNNANKSSCSIKEQTSGIICEDIKADLQSREITKSFKKKSLQIGFGSSVYQISKNERVEDITDNSNVVISQKATKIPTTNINRLTVKQYKTFSRNILRNVDKANRSSTLLTKNLLKNNFFFKIHNKYFHNRPSTGLAKDSNDEITLHEVDINKNVESEEFKEFHVKHGIKASTSKMEINKIPEIEFVDNEQTRTLLSLFPAPKSVLNNIYDEVVKETKQKIFKVAPQFRAVKDSKNSLWVCTYHIRWPEEIKFKATDSKKRLASHKAALAALNWLKSAQKLTKKGIPVIYEKDEITKLVNKTVPVLLLDNSTLKNMQKIKELHQEQILPHIVKSQKEIDQNNNEGVCETPAVQEPDNVNLKSIKKQRYIGLNQYLAKEKIELPISAYKADFIKLLKENQIIIVKGEPGCGKSTRIPQYVLEAWAKEDGLLGEHGHIAVTQPRRIAAISLAERVSIERNESVGNIVGYQVRLKSNFRPETGRILYCTTGILLRHIQADPNLSRFTHVILDEAHERDVNTDLLMNLLRRATKTNAKLKLIIMSATIDTRMFSDYFGGVPIMDIPGFTYPVAQHFLDTCKKIDVSKTLKMCDSQVPSVIHEDVVRIMQFIHDKKKEGAILCFLPGWEDISKIKKMIPERGDIVVYCLHSRLLDSEQWRIFSRPPPGVRKIILATNIAETSVTIDDVVYVIDTGIHKEQRFDVDKGVNCLDNHWISKASANQRKGRAGRCQAGESFHLYPKSQYESFIEYSLPEIMRTSLTKIVLDSKVYSNNMNALEFSRQLPTCPEENAVIKAVDELVDLELLDDKENLTTLGKTVANFQLEPKLSKAMVNSVIFKCVTPIVDIVTLFSAETELFVSGLMDKGEVKHVKGQFSKTSDHLAMMRLFEKWLEIAENGNKHTLNTFCNDTNLIPYKMATLEKLRKIHFDYLYDGLYDIMPIADNHSDNDELVKAVLFSGIGTILTHRNWDIVKNKVKNNTHVFLTRNNHKATITSESVNFKRQKYPSNFLVYINETRSNIRKTTLVRECSLISKISVLLFSNRNLGIIEIDKENFSENIPSTDQVKLRLENTNVELLCDRVQAQELINCKDALMAGYRYYIQQLTEIGEPNSEINNSWDKILSILSTILSKSI